MIKKKSSDFICWALKLSSQWFSFCCILRSMVPMAIICNCRCVFGPHFLSFIVCSHQSFLCLFSHNNCLLTMLAETGKNSMSLHTQVSCLLHWLCAACDFSGKVAADARVGYWNPVLYDWYLPDWITILILVPLKYLSCWLKYLPSGAPKDSALQATETSPHVSSLVNITLALMAAGSLP